MAEHLIMFICKWKKGYLNRRSYVNKFSIFFSAYILLPFQIEPKRVLERKIFNLKINRILERILEMMCAVVHSRICFLLLP